MTNYKHNPDINPNWKPKMARRVYRCSECNNEVITETNHTGSCYPVCEGKCRQIINPHTAREIVMKKMTKHLYIKEAE